MADTTKQKKLRKALEDLDLPDHPWHGRGGEYFIRSNLHEALAKESNRVEEEQLDDNEAFPGRHNTRWHPKRREHTPAKRRDREMRKMLNSVSDHVARVLAEEAEEKAKKKKKKK